MKGTAWYHKIDQSLVKARQSFNMLADDATADEVMIEHLTIYFRRANELGI